MAVSSAGFAKLETQYNATATAHPDELERLVCRLKRIAASTWSTCNGCKQAASQARDFSKIENGLQGQVDNQLRYNGAHQIESMSEHSANAELQLAC